MRASWITLSVLLATALFASTSFAQSGTTKAASGSDSSTKPSASAGSAGQRKDPKGITGVSPYVELLVKGHAAVAVKDFGKAIEIYNEAIGKEPEKAPGYYFLGEAQLGSNKLEEAEKSWQSALKNVGADDVMRAKVMFVLADLRERQSKLDDALTAWKDYGAFVAAHPNCKGYAATATERERVLETRKDMAVKYAKVKERIAQRLEESTKGEPPKVEPPKAAPKATGTKPKGGK
jgi:tetratricopeptide (TPR) repeat protein